MNAKTDRNEGSGMGNGPQSESSCPSTRAGSILPLRSDGTRPDETASASEAAFEANWTRFRRMTEDKVTALRGVAFLLDRLGPMRCHLPKCTAEGCTPDGCWCEVALRLLRQRNAEKAG